MSKENWDMLLYWKPRSEETKRRISEAVKIAKPKQWIMFSCVVCWEQFYRNKKSNQICCSRDCSYKYSQKQEKRECLCCWNSFYTNEGREKKLCSWRCARLYRWQTDIEKIMEDWLIEQWIEYEKEKPLLWITIVDFFIEPNIVVYCDWDYWHNLPIIKRKDYLQNKTLRENWYKVFRLRGKEIKEWKRPLLFNN